MTASSDERASDVSSADEEDSTDGFRLIGITILMSIFYTFLCSKCKSAQIVMKEDITAKMGLVSQLSLECSSEKCSYFMNFYTSSRVNNTSKAFEANRRVVLARRNIGDGHHGKLRDQTQMSDQEVSQENRL